MKCHTDEPFEGRNDLGEPMYTCMVCGRQEDKDGNVTFVPKDEMR